jgi:hypothetical protein
MAAFSNYKDMLACSTEKTLCEHLDVPTYLKNTKLRPFFVGKTFKHKLQSD